MTHSDGEPGPAAAGQAPPLIAVIAAAFLVLCMVLPLVVIAWAAWCARRSLRLCPVCGDRAGRNAGSEDAGFVESRLTVQCGQCGTWRRVLISQAGERAHARRLGREQRRIRRLMLQLEAERRALDVRTFIEVLRA